MENFSRETKAGTLQGSYDPKFKEVVDTFVENFETRRYQRLMVLKLHEL